MPRPSLPNPSTTLPVAPATGPVSHARDLEFVARIISGDEAAWQQFVLRYAGLICSIARRYLHSRDHDDVQSVLADVLDVLKRARLSTYEGRAALSTWLTLVTRSVVMDRLRHEFGRGVPFRAMKTLSPAERIVYRHYYVEGRTPSEVLASLAERGEHWTLDRLVAALQRIEKHLGDRWLRRLSYDLHAQSIGAASGRLLEYLDHVRDEYQQSAGAFSPEYHLMEREARRTTDRVRAMVEQLPAADRRMLELRFQEGWTAQRIANELGIVTNRGVYSAIDRILRGLRRRLAGAREEAK